MTSEKRFFFTHREVRTFGGHQKISFAKKSSTQAVDPENRQIQSIPSHIKSFFRISLARATFFPNKIFCAQQIQYFPEKRKNHIFQMSSEFSATFREEQRHLALGLATELTKKLCQFLFCRQNIFFPESQRAKSVHQSTTAVSWLLRCLRKFNFKEATSP